MKKNIFTVISFLLIAIGIQGVYPLESLLAWTLILIAHIDNDMRLRYLILLMVFAQLTNLMRTHCMSLQILYPDSLTNNLCHAFIV
jgi:hypothetical protein